jgi:hypothetical protein
MVKKIILLGALIAALTLVSQMAIAASDKTTTHLKINETRS